MEKSNYWYSSEQILKLFKEKSFLSWNCGVSNTERKNLNRVSKILNKLNELNNYTLRDNTAQFFQNISMAIKNYMKESNFELVVNKKTGKYTFKRVVK